MNLQEIKSELKNLLGREPSCSLLKDGKYMADYFRFGAKPTEFVGTTEDEALEKLHTYIKQLKKDETPR